MVKGSIVALITPFNQDKTVNFTKLEQLIEWHIENKTDAILVLGTTGESPTMSHEEDDAVIECAVRVSAGRVPIIAGTGSNSTETMLEKSLRAEKSGANGLLLISPYYNKTNLEGMYQHFKTVADAVNIPCILYNVPGRTSCEIPVSVVARLAQHKNICGIKEASGNMSYSMKVSRLLSNDFCMWSGNDDIIVPIMSIGGSGVISVVANALPNETHMMVEDYLSGNYQKSLEAQLQLLPFINNLFIEVNPIPIKTALMLMGKDNGIFRQPLYEMEQSAKQKLEESMKDLGLI